MKKRVIYGFTVLLALMLVLPLSACKKKDVVNDKPQKKVVLADFESFDDVYNVMHEYSTIRFTGTYTLTSHSEREGKVEPIAGDSSLELHIEGMLADDYYSYNKYAGTPAMFFYSIFENTEHGEYCGIDWRTLSGASVEIYNDNDFEISVSMYSYLGNRYPRNYGSVVVPAKSTATLEVNVNRYFMQSENTKALEVFAFAVNYDKQVLEDGSLYYPEAYVYMDNLTVELDKTSLYNKDGSAVIAKVPKTNNEILSFNDAADLEYVREFGSQYLNEVSDEWNTFNWAQGTGSSYHYNTNSEYTREGNSGSMEWRLNPSFNTTYSSSAYRYLTDQNYLYSGAMTGITVCSDYLNYLNLSALKDGNAKILVDVYNAGNFDKEVGFGIYDNSGIATEVKKEYPYNYGSKDNYNQWFKLRAGEWTTLELTDFSYLDLSQGLARLWLVTSMIDVTDPMSFYVNNLRIEYNSEATSSEGGNESVVSTTDTSRNLNEVAKNTAKPNTVYDFETAYGLENHLGGSFVNYLSVNLVDFAEKTDMNGKSLKIDPSHSAVEKEMYQKGIKSGMYLKSYSELGRAVLTNPINVDWDEQYEQLYFYFYNAGTGWVTINFNNYSQSFKAKQGWQKVVLGEKTVGSKTITDYSLISALGNATTVGGMVDLEDCVGTFMMFNCSDNPFDEFAMTSIYGVPKKN